jgi:alpha-glucosidase (family GH31 glycosyl hydrolase)
LRVISEIAIFIQAIRDVVANYEAADLPLDTQWSDIDYLDKYRDFTYDSQGNYAGLKDFVDELHGKNMKYIPIIDAGLAYRNDYDQFKEGQDKDVFIKSPNGETFVG